MMSLKLNENRLCNHRLFLQWQFINEFVSNELALFVNSLTSVVARLFTSIVLLNSSDLWLFFHVINCEIVVWLDWLHLDLEFSSVKGRKFVHRFAIDFFVGIAASSAAFYRCFFYSLLKFDFVNCLFGSLLFEVWSELHLRVVEKKLLKGLSWKRVTATFRRWVCNVFLSYRHWYTLNHGLKWGNLWHQWIFHAHHVRVKIWLGVFFFLRPPASWCVASCVFEALLSDGI